MRWLNGKPSAIATKQAMKHLSGLEYVQAVAEGNLADSPMHILLGIRSTMVEHGHVVYRCAVMPRFLTSLGSAHPGFAAALLESCMSSAVHSSLPPARKYATLEFKISLIRQITALTGELTADGRVMRTAERIAFAEGRLDDSKNRLLAHATLTCLLTDI
jgi:uncharacterized protein (TIGR00369 family)